ncbi:MAG: hypothetical protein L0Z55_03675 [Planctomycetes bacterium]|nr:hypothetical protein [Planctomycetota bacterium]
MVSHPAKLFRAEFFESKRDWLHFAVEFDLELCDGCQRTGRRRPAAEASERSPWFCPDCAPPFHPDLIRALRTRANVRTRCMLCQSEVAIGDCWVSEDCQRLYCASHLQPLRALDRMRMAKHLLEARSGADLRGDRLAMERQISRLDRHLQSVDCSTCSFNGRGIYDGETLLEVDRGEHRCDSAPDAFHCGDLDAELVDWR